MKRQPVGDLPANQPRKAKPSPAASGAASEAPDTIGDHELIRRAQAGDERGFELLVRRYEERAWRVARNMVPSDDDARDLVQDAFLRVFRSLDRFDFQHEFSTWLYRIVTNLAIDQLRKRRPVTSTTGSDDEGENELEFADPDAPSPSHRAEALETAARVRVCLASLAPHFRSVLALREIEGLGCPEIAGIVGATHVTVRWRLHRGRKLFQEEWERRERLSERGDRDAWNVTRPPPAEAPNDSPDPDVDPLEFEEPTS